MKLKPIFFFMSFFVFACGPTKVPLPGTDLSKSKDEKLRKGAAVFKKNNWTCGELGPSKTGFFSSFDKTRLFFRSCKKEESNRAIVLIHGFGTSDHSGRMGELVSKLFNSGFSVFAIDLRGQGHSEGIRNHIDDKEDYAGDIAVAVEKAKKDFGVKKVFLFGHSNGGLSVINYALKNSGSLRGLVLSSPMLEWELKLPFYKKYPGFIVSLFWGSLADDPGVKFEDLSHDPKMVSENKVDPLLYNKVTVRWATESIYLMKYMRAEAKNIKLPLLMILAGDDKINSREANEKWFKEYGGENKTLKIYEGFYHEVFYEKERHRPINDMDAWLKKFLF